MISEGSCDAEDWSNDAENHRNQLKYFIIENRYFKCNNISMEACFRHWIKN